MSIALFTLLCSPQVLNELGLLGLRIQRMPCSSGEFANPLEYDYLTVCTTSASPAQPYATICAISYRALCIFTLLNSPLPPIQVCAPSCHDCSTMRAWWEEDRDRRLRYAREMLNMDVEEVPDRCTPEVANTILMQHCQAPSVWAIFPLQVCVASIFKAG